MNSVSSYLRRIPRAFTIGWSIVLFVLCVTLFLISVYIMRAMVFYDFHSPPQSQVETSAVLSEWQTIPATHIRGITATRRRTVRIDGPDCSAQLEQFEDQVTGERQFDYKTLQTTLHYWPLAGEFVIMLLIAEAVGLPVLCALRFGWRTLAARRSAKHNRHGFDVLSPKRS